MKILRSKILWSLILYGWMIFIYIMTSRVFPGKEQTDEAFGFRLDYPEHFIVYMLIPVFYYLSRGAYLQKIFRDAYYVFLLGMLFSILTEIQQYYIEGRAFNMIDLALNVAGFLVGIPAGRFVKKLVFGKSAEPEQEDILPGS